MLELEDRCYYIGKTRDLQGRSAGHFISVSAGAEWTREHKPIRVLKEINVPDVCLPAGLFEDMITRKYMLNFGIEFTGGGSYASRDISGNTCFALKREFAHARDKCFYYGNMGHFARDCPACANEAARAGSAGGVEGIGAGAPASASTPAFNPAPTTFVSEDCSQT